jgi:hypothetical protein
MSSISTAIFLKNATIADQLMGNTGINHKVIKTFSEYDDIYRVRHDLIHAAICDNLSVPFGEQTFEYVFREHKELIGRQYYEDIKMQTPDYLSVNGKSVRMFEVSISTDFRSKTNKASKYSLMIYFLRKNGYKVNYDIYVINPKNVFMNRDELLQLGLNDVIIDLAYKICNNCNLLLYDIHRTDLGQFFYKTRMEITESKMEFDFKKEDMDETIKSMKNKCFHETKDLDSMLESSTNVITSEDNDFLSECLNRVEKTQSLLMIKEDFNRSEFMDMMKSKSTTNDLRSVFPLPYLKMKVLDSSIRSTEEDWELLNSFCGKLVQSEDSILVTMGKSCQFQLNNIRNKENRRNEDYLFVCKFDLTEREVIALEGPGRKTYIKSGSMPHLKNATEKNGYSLNPTIDVSDIEKISFELSKINNIRVSGGLEEDMDRLSQASGPGLDYLRICQSIYREININSMRGDRRHRHLIKPTGVRGVFIFIYKGPKLRCGELANIVWFKLLIDKDEMHQDQDLQNHWSFKRLLRDNKVYHSGWLSCDVHRLDHYIRCFDKVIMAYAALASQQYKSSFDIKTAKEIKDQIEDDVEKVSKYSLLNLIQSDCTNALGLMIMIFLEDKRSTSKMIQNVRYLVMTSISMFPRYSSVMEKFSDAIRSPLQLYCLKKSMDYIESMKEWRVGANVSFGNVKYDYKTHTFLDGHGGICIRLPRPLVTSYKIMGDFSEILCEMYFTMLFNKNQDDPTHASFQILDKILEGESNFQQVKADGNHLGYRNDMSDIEFMDEILSKKRNHMFSRRAIMIGSKLLRIHNDDPTGLKVTECALRKNINKTLDEYATYKSSARFEQEHYDPMKLRQNSRSRCMEQVIELEQEGLMDSFDVMDQYKKEETYFHIFKKNQIGGVREILILPMTVRIRINILETLSRNLCKLDKREVLTHGSVKNESIKSALYTSKKYEGNRAPIHLTFDKSKWGPSFVPIQFMYLFLPFKSQLSGFLYFIIDLLVRHQNKFCLLPDRLVKAWYTRTDKKHNFPQLQKLKEKFIRDKSLKMDNESNMGQGILHFTSSLLHLSMVAFRDKLYSMLCKKNGWDHNDHEDLLSSDDSYTIFCPEVIKKQGKASFIIAKLTAFLKCQQLSEYLFNCRTSVVKSSINPLIGEFNSLFIGNMTFIPTLMKFAISSVHPPNTDSFFRLVKECYSSSRQIVENGGGLDIYYLSHILNKKYSESIYHTYPGGANDLRKMNINKMPYHLGFYPLFNPALMVIFGPDYYNYKLYKQDWDTMNDHEKKLFSSSHKIIKGGVIETMAEYEDGDTILGGLMRIEAAIGPIKQHNRIKEKSILTQEQITSVLINRPLLMIQRAKTLEEVIFKTCQKIFTTGAKEAVKNIAASIYYGRVSATVSAKAFYIPNGSIEKQTYMECLNQLINVESPVTNLDEQLKFLYPKYVDYDVFIKNENYYLDYMMRNPFEIQTVQTLVTHKIFTKLTQPITDLLEYKWMNKQIPEHIENKVNRDFDIMKIHYPLLKDSLEETKDQFSGTEEDKSKSVLLLMLKLYSLRERVFKGIIHGFGSNDISRTYEILLERNYSSGISTKLISEYVGRTKHHVDYDKIYHLVNLDTLLILTNQELKEPIWDDLEEREINIMLQDPGLNKNIKKRVFMSAVTNGFINNIEDWSSRVSVIMHVWFVKQKRVGNKYVGNFDICLFLGSNRLYCYYSQELDMYYFQKRNNTDPTMLWEMFSELSELIGVSIDIMISKCPKGQWFQEKNKILRTINGFEIREAVVNEPIDFSNCELEVDDKWIRMQDPGGYRIFSMETGLLSTDYIPEKKYNVKFYGIDYNKMCENGVFRVGFSPLYHDRNKFLEMMDDLIVPQPKVSDMTKNRLKLSENWESYKEDAEVNLSYIDETSFVEELMSADISSIAAEIQKEVENKEIDQSAADMVLFLMSTDSIVSMKTDARIHQTRKLFMRIKNLKYDLISINFLNDLRVNKRIISIIGSIVKNGLKKYILFSLISLYDRSFQVDGHESPTNIVLNINQNFITKFGVRTKEEEEEISFD